MIAPFRVERIIVRSAISDTITPGEGVSFPWEGMPGAVSAAIPMPVPWLPNTMK